MSKYSKYKYVSFHRSTITHNTYEYWQTQLSLPNGKKWNKKCKTEKEAALAVDLKLIELGREPVNTLKRK